MASIAFIGLGNMGGPMTANLVRAGHKVVAFDLVAASRDQAKADGAAIAESSVAAVKGADTVITMLPAGKHVLSVWNDVVPSMTKGTLIIDCSTIDVESAKQAHALAAKHGLSSVDAPVSGVGIQPVDAAEEVQVRDGRHLVVQARRVRHQAHARPNRGRARPARSPAQVSRQVDPGPRCLRAVRLSISQRCEAGMTFVVSPSDPGARRDLTGSLSRRLSLAAFRGGRTGWRRG